MRILLVHNFYQQTGGEDFSSFADEARLLASRGHDVVRLSVHNDEVNCLSKLALAYRTIWSRPAVPRRADGHRYASARGCARSQYAAATVAIGLSCRRRGRRAGRADAPQLPVDVPCSSVLSGWPRVYRLCRGSLSPLERFVTRAIEGAVARARRS